MNAVIALCHFCEAHGPCPIFCTQTLRDTKLEEIDLQNLSSSKLLCSACNTLEQSSCKGFYSTDAESCAIFLSTQVSALSEAVNLIKHAATRSLSCEINSQKDGGFVFFGDTSRGHVLSHTFHVCDLQARGFFQLYSIVVLMKDKYFLLNTKPFLAEHLRKISTEIKTLAENIKENEMAKISPCQRRISNPQMMVQTPRSLSELTGEENIFAHLHSHFAWILLAGAKFLTEHVTFGNLPWLPPQSSGRPPQQRLTYNINTLPMIQKYEANLDDPEQEEFFSLRHIKQIVNKEFEAVCFCVLTGTKIIVRGSQERTFNFMMCLKKLLPEKMHHLIRVDAQHQHSISSDYKIISLSNEIAVPTASKLVFRVDYLDGATDGNQILVKWPGELPNKLPNLMVKLMKAVDDKRFTESVLNKQTKVLVEEWKNKVICLNCIKSLNGQTRLKKSLGVQPQDQPLINYWSTHLH